MMGDIMDIIDVDMLTGDKSPKGVIIKKRIQESQEVKGTTNPFKKKTKIRWKNSF
jgi:hypothetical protein